MSRGSRASSENGDSLTDWEHGLIASPQHWVLLWTPAAHSSRGENSDGVLMPQNPHSSSIAGTPRTDDIFFTSHGSHAPRSSNRYWIFWLSSKEISKGRPNGGLWWSGTYQFPTMEKKGSSSWRIETAVSPTARNLTIHADADHAPDWKVDSPVRSTTN